MSLSKQQREFLANIAPLCQEQAYKHEYKLFASVAIAQAIHESGWGTSKRMVAANALFGVKVGKSAYKFGTAWKGAAYKTGTTEYYDGKNPTKIVDYFRQYNSISDSVEDYMDMLCHCKRYRAALNCTTPEQSIKAIIAGGYATGPSYVKAIMKLINLYNLTQYDQKGQIKEVNPYTEINKVLKRGARGEAVKYLQWFLVNKGFKIKIDGSFGPATEEAVLRYQEDTGLKVDGIVGAKTWEQLKK